MEHTTEIPLTTVQQCVVTALAAGSTITAAAEANGIQRITVYRWMKTCKPFSAALHRARAEFLLATRDKLYHLSSRALDSLLAILDNPKSSPAVLLRTSMFILQRPQMPKTGWSMPEPAPNPDGEKLVDSAIIEQDYDSLPGLSGIERQEERTPPPNRPLRNRRRPRNRPSRPLPIQPDVTKCYTVCQIAMTLHRPRVILPPPSTRNTAMRTRMPAETEEILDPARHLELAFPCQTFLILVGFRPRWSPSGKA